MCETCWGRVYGHTTVACFRGSCDLCVRDDLCTTTSRCSFCVNDPSPPLPQCNPEPQKMFPPSCTGQFNMSYIQALLANSESPYPVYYKSGEVFGWFFVHYPRYPKCFFYLRVTRFFVLCVLIVSLSQTLRHGCCEICRSLVFTLKRTVNLTPCDNQC